MPEVMWHYRPVTHEQLLASHTLAGDNILSNSYLGSVRLSVYERFYSLRLKSIFLRFGYFSFNLCLFILDMATEEKLWRLKCCMQFQRVGLAIFTRMKIKYEQKKRDSLKWMSIHNSTTNTKHNSQYGTKYHRRHRLRHRIINRHCQHRHHRKS